MHSHSHVTGFDPLLAMASMLVALAHAQAAPIAAAPGYVPQPAPGATTRERAVHHRTFGRPLGDGRSKAQRDADKLAASIGYGRGGRRI